MADSRRHPNPSQRDAWLEKLVRDGVSYGPRGGGSSNSSSARSMNITETRSGSPRRAASLAPSTPRTSETSSVCSGSVSSRSHTRSGPRAASSRPRRHCCRRACTLLARSHGAQRLDALGPREDERQASVPARRPTAPLFHGHLSGSGAAATCRAAAPNPVMQQPYAIAAVEGSAIASDEKRQCPYSTNPRRPRGGLSPLPSGERGGCFSIRCAVSA
jgi:hypothetical protein